MRVFVLVVFISMFALGEATEGRKCFAPVYCTNPDNTGRPEWLQVSPPPKCHWTQSGNGTHKVNKTDKSDPKIIETIKKDVEEQKMKTTELNEKCEQLALNDENQEAKNNELTEKYAELTTNLTLSKENQDAKTNDLTAKYKELAYSFTFNKEKYEEMATDLTLSKEKIRDLTTKLNATEEQLANLSDRNDDLKTEVQRLDKAREDALKSFQEKLNDLTAAVKDLTTQPVCEEGVYHQGFCYFAIIHASQDMDYTKSVENCQAKSSKPADILDSIQYNMIFKYVRSLSTSLSNRFLWLGMTINPSTEVVSLSNGNRAPYVRYDSGYPTTDSSFTQMAVDVDQDLLEASQGMWNLNPTTTMHGVLCQKLHSPS